MTTLAGGRYIVDARGGQGRRGEKGDTGNGANPFPAIAGEDPDDVLDESYLPGDIRRYGIQPDDGIDHASVNPSRVTAFLNSSTLPNVYAYVPRGEYNFDISLAATDNSRIHFDSAQFHLVHITTGSSNVDWSGEILTDDRFGISNDSGSCTNIRLGIVRAVGASRVVHLAGPVNLSFDLIHVENTDTCDVSGDQSNLAAVYIESQGNSGCRGRIVVDSSETGGVYVNMLDVDLDIEVAAYGGTAIDAGANAFQGLTTAQTERGAGVLLHRCTGKARVKVRQGHTSPAADTYPLWVPETGTTADAKTRHNTLDLSGLDVDVGDGNRGVVIGPEDGTFTTCNVIMPGGAHIALRTGDTLAANYAGLTISPPIATEACYTRVSGAVTFAGFGTVPRLKATAVTTSAFANFTELDLRVRMPDVGAAQAIDLDGTGGVLRGKLHIEYLYLPATSSFADPLVEIVGCTDFHLTGTKIESENPLNAAALRTAGCTDCTFAVDDILNFYRGSSGGWHIDAGNVRCTFGPTRLTTTGSIVAGGEGIRISGAQTDPRLIGLHVSNFGDGFKNGTSMAFTRPVAIGCVATGNTDDTDLTTIDIPAANQLGCTNLTA